MGEEMKAAALVVGDDQAQRAMVSMLLEETDIHVIQCEVPKQQNWSWKKLADVFA